MSAAEQTTAPLIWRHECPFAGAEIDEHDPQILECRCFEGPRFLAAQDQMAINLDSIRAPRLITENAVSPTAPGLDPNNGSALENAK